MTDAILILRGLEEMYPEIEFVSRLRQALEDHPDLNWGDALSRGQTTSKLWLVHELIMNKQYDLGHVALCGGWVGLLARMIFDEKRINVDHIHSLDISAVATFAARTINQEYVNHKFTSTVADCHDMMYKDQYNTVINTSCEHFQNFSTWTKRISPGRLVVLQSNDFTEMVDHVNCVSSAEELADQANLETVMFTGALPCIKYTRYMVIGVK